MVKALSITNSIWTLRDNISKEADKELIHFPQPIRAILINRGIKDAGQAEEYLHPSKSMFLDPFLLFDMKDATDLITTAINSNTGIAIHGDFDVDGVCATAILTDYLRNILHANIIPYIPHRVDEGYGLTEASISELIKHNVKLVITVDCGIRDKELIQKYTKKGLTFIVTDHHALREESNSIVLPDCIVIHPNHPEGDYPCKELSGSGIAWKIISAFELNKNNNSLSDTALSYLDLASLATVCDIMPLTGENRLIVKFGIDEIRKTHRPGLSALIKQSGISKDIIDAYHLGYVLGPRINAAGRLDSAMDALQLLINQEEYVISSLADKLEHLNTQRQLLTQTSLDEALDQVEHEIDNPLYFVSNPGWKEGIIGLIAGRLTEKYNKPAIAVSTSSAVARGSARSPLGFNIIDALSKYSQFFKRYGGHSQAAGFSIDIENINKAKTALTLYAKEVITNVLPTREVKIDTKISTNDLDLGIIDYIEMMAPTGYGNPTPVFMIGPLTINLSQPVGKDGSHIKYLFNDKQTNKNIEAIWFSTPEEAKKIKQGTQVYVAANITKNIWNGKTSIQLRLQDIKVLPV